MKTVPLNNETQNYKINQCLSSTHINKLLYNIQIENMKLTEQKHIIKWERELSKEDIEWKGIFSLSYKSTISTKLRAFQYKYLMRIIPNNDYLFKCKLKPSNLCEFCHMNVDSNKHMFWECTVIQPFWSDISLLQWNPYKPDTMGTDHFVRLEGFPV